jgi:hypothetical protein
MKMFSIALIVLSFQHHNHTPMICHQLKFPASQTAHTKVQLLGTFAKLQKATISFVMSIHMSAGNHSTPTGCTLMKFDT